jgi:hypothetical protein
MAKLRPKAGEIYVCIESFGSNSDPEMPGCNRGARLLGNNKIVKRWPQFFVPDGTDDAEIHRLRTKMYADAGSPPPPQ